MLFFLQELFGSNYDEDVPTHYGLNMINQKITFPRDDNFSDDELSFLPYFVFFNAIKVHLYVCALSFYFTRKVKG